MLTRFVPQWVLDQYPWAVDVLAWFETVRQFFHAYEGLIVICGLAFLWRCLRHERLRLGERIDTLRQIVTAVRDESEVAPAPASMEPAPALPPTASQAAKLESGREYFEIIRQLWRETRDRIELAIEEIPRSRVRSKYGQFPRYNYKDVIFALHKDEVLGGKEMTELLRMNSIFDGLRSRPAAATSQQVESFKEAYSIGTKKLPRLPDGREEPPAPVPAPSAPEQSLLQPQTAA